MWQSAQATPERAWMPWFHVSNSGCRAFIRGAPLSAWTHSLTLSSSLVATICSSFKPLLHGKDRRHGAAENVATHPAGQAQPNRLEQEHAQHHMRAGAEGHQRSDFAPALKDVGEHVVGDAGPADEHDDG